MQLLSYVHYQTYKTTRLYDLQIQTDFNFQGHRFQQSIFNSQFSQTSFITLLLALFFDVFILAFSFNFNIGLVIKFEFIRLLGLCISFDQINFIYRWYLLWFILLVVIEFIYYYFMWLTQLNVLCAQSIYLFELFLCVTQFG